MNQHIEYRVVEAGKPCFAGGDDGNGTHLDYAYAAAHLEAHHTSGRAEVQSRTVTVTEWTREES